MRFLCFLLLFSACAGVSPLKYKYSSSKRYLASLTREDVVVAKIEAQLKDPEVFASGMDSTFLIVTLFDRDGAILTDIDPSDLTLSSNVDIEAKPFTLKQGVYKAEILPRVRSPHVTLRVDWQEKVASGEVILRASAGPRKEKLTPVAHDFWETKNSGEINVSRGSATPQHLTEGFSFENLGNNKIVNTKVSPHAQRAFGFDYPEHARQNVSMTVDDVPNSMVSHTMHSVFMFFPRKQLPVVEQLTGILSVTLPTGEKMVFAKDSKEIVDGVFLEGPIERNQFADLRYVGKGVLLRVNGRGESPELAEGSQKIDLDWGLKGSDDVLIFNGTTGQKCRRPKSDFWEQIDVSPIEFKFATDEDFDVYLKANCGFSLPKR